MKRTTALFTAAVMLAGTLFSCAGKEEAVSSTTSDISASVGFLESRVEDTSDIIVGDAGTALAYGIDMTDFEDEGYTVRTVGGETLILGKTAAGVDRAVRDYVKHADEYEYSVTCGEGYRVEKLTVAGRDIAGYVILIPADADECVRFASSELAMFIERACGASLPTVTEDPGTDNVIELRPEPKDGELGEEGFATTVSDGRITVRGGETRGCMYGVYDLLEDCVGYRFLTSEVTHLYESEHVDIPEGYENKELPGFAYRFVYDHPCRYTYYKGSFYSDGDFSARRKSNNISSTNEAKYGYSGLKNAHHGMSVYVKSVPDSQQPCLTDDAIFDECLENIMAYLDANDALGYIGTKVKCVDLGQNDNNGFCNCKNCVKAYRNYKSQSGLFADFTNRIAEEVSKVYPDILVGMFAYWGAIIPPQNIELHPNVQVCYVIYGFCQKHPLDGSKCNPEHYFQERLNHVVHKEYITEWHKLTDNLQVWFYTVDFWRGLHPFMNIDDYCSDFRYLASLELKGIFCQNGQSQLIFDDLYVYLESLLAWDPYMSEEEFYAKAEEFMMLFYGDGWESLYEYLMAGCREKDSRPCGDNDPHDWYAEEYDYLKSLFADAAENCNSAKQADRIELLSLHMHYQALCGFYDEKYVNGTAEEKEQMQTLAYWLRDELAKYRITWLGLESGTPMSELSFDLAEMDPNDY